MTHHRRRNNGTGTSDTNEAELSPAQRYAAFKQTQAKQRTVAAEFARSMSFELDEFQLQANEALETGNNVLVAGANRGGQNGRGRFCYLFGTDTKRQSFLYHADQGVEQSEVS